MKKRVAVLSVIGLILMLGGIALSLFMGQILPFEGVPPYKAMTFITNILKLITGPYEPMTFMSFIGAGVAGLLVILMIIQIVLLAKKRHGAAVGVTIVTLLAAAATYLMVNMTLAPGSIKADFYNDIADFGPIGIGIACAKTQQWLGLLYFAPAVVFVIGFIMILVALFSDMKLLADLPDPVLDLDSTDEVVVIHDDDVEPERAAAPAAEALAAPGATIAPASPVAPAAPASVAAPGFQGPILVQYINTYGPSAEPVKKTNSVPVSEIQGAITGEKPLTAEDIRKIVRETMGEKKDQPVIVNVPAAPKPEATALTAEDVRQIFSDELGRYLSSEEEEEEYPSDAEIYVEEEPEPSLTADDIRSIIAAELARAKPEEPAAKPQAVEQPVDVREVIRAELEAHRRELDEEARRQAEEEAARKAHEEEIARARAEAAEEARRQAEEAAPALTADDIRAIIAAELAKKPEPQPEPKPEMSLDLIREVIRSELRDVAPVREQPVPPVTVVVKESDIVRPTPAPEPKPEPEPAPVPVVNIIVKSNDEPAAAQDAAPSPAEEEGPSVARDSVPAPAEEEEGEGKDKIIRIPFPVRLLASEPDLLKNYNEIKSEIMSYGVKSRVSNSGDTFRLHRVTFVKVTVAGKGLKLYFALNPEDYANSTLPVQNAGHKGAYRDIPLVFKVKSELSVRRAKQLIADVMEKNGLEQGKIETRDWASELKDYKPAGASDDED